MDFYKMQIRHELPGADGTDELHEPGAAIETVHADHVVHPVRPGAHGGQLEIDEIHVVAQKDIGRLYALHVHLFDGILLAEKGDF